jgi:hypothetical protein
MATTYRGPDGVLYPSKEWYDANVAKVNVPKTTVPKTTAVSVTPTTTQNQDIYDQLEQIKQQALTIKSQIPQVTDFEEETPGLSMPGGTVQTPDISTAQSTTDYWKTYYENQQKLADQQKAEMEAKTKEFETEKQSWLDKAKSAFGLTQEEKATQEYEELGIKPAEYFAEKKADIAEMESLYASYNAKVAERDTKVAEVDNIGMPQNWTDDRKIVIQNKYNAELNLMAAGINSKAAIMEAKQGRFEEARSFVNEAVSAYVADMKFQYAQYQDFVEMNQEFLDSLGADYKDTLNKIDSALLQKIQLTEQEKTKVMELSVNYPNAGITINDSYNEALAKTSRFEATQPEETTEFTTTQKLALEQAGLTGAARQTQLDYLQNQGLLGGTAGTEAEFTEKVNRIQVFMNARIGTDNLISAETYNEANKLWMTLGGTKSDWITYFPPESFMRTSEIQRLYNLYPSVYTEPSGGGISNSDLAG